MKELNKVAEFNKAKLGLNIKAYSELTQDFCAELGNVV
jgi:hypothetical protein